MMLVYVHTDAHTHWANVQGTQPTNVLTFVKPCDSNTVLTTLVSVFPILYDRPSSSVCAREGGTLTHRAERSDKGYIQEYPVPRWEDSLYIRS